MVGGTLRGNGENEREGNCPRCIVIRQLSGFRTVSNEAVLVLAKTIPVGISANEMRRIYFHRLECPGQKSAMKVEERRNSMRKWQSRC